MSRVQDELAWCGAIATVISASQAAPVMTNSPPKQTAKYTASRQPKRIEKCEMGVSLTVS